MMRINHPRLQSGAVALSVLIGFIFCMVQSGCTRAEETDWRTTSRLPGVIETPLNDDPMQVTIHRLENGLTVYLSPNPDEPRIEARIGVRAGSSHDPEASTGLAHYLEHMLFKGSQRLGTTDYGKEKPHLDRIQSLYEELFKATDESERKKLYAAIDEENRKAAQYAVPNEFDKLYKALGVRGVNAYTSGERTVYTCALPKNQLEAWARVEADRFQNRVFRLFQTELETVYEEKNRSLDNPGRILWQAFQKDIYGQHPYARPTLGTVEHLKNPSLKRMLAFFDTYYVPNNMAIVLAGDFDRKAALTTIRKHFSTWIPKPLPPRKPYRLPVFSEPNETTVRYEAEESLMMGWPLVSNRHPDRHALAVMDMLVANSTAGILDLEINQKQRTRRAGAFPIFKNEAGVWHMTGTPKKDQSLEEVEELLLSVVDRLKAGAFTDADIKAVVTDLEVSEKRRLESNGSRAGKMLSAFTAFKSWEEEVRWLAPIRAVTRGDVLRVAKAYIGNGRAVVKRKRGKPEIPSIPKPSFTKVNIEPTRKSRFFEDILSMETVPVTPRWLAAGSDYEIHPQPWGQLFWAKNPMNDLFSITFHFKRGWRHEPALALAMRLAGLAGAGKLDAPALKKKLYAMGTSMHFACSEQDAYVTVEGLDAHFLASLQLVRERLSQPNIGEETVKRLKAIELGRRKDSKINPDSLRHALGEFARRGHESSVLGQMTNEALAAVTQERLTGLLQTLFDHAREVTYVGQRPATDILAAITESKKLIPPAKRTPRLYVRPDKSRILLLHREMVQAQIGVFTPDESWTPENWADYAFYSNYVGGGMSSVIFQEIREARSLAYVAWGGYQTGSRKQDENALVGYVGTQADKAVEATELLVSLLRSPPWSEARFQEAHRSMEERFRTSHISFRSIPGRILSWQEAGIDKDPRPSRMTRALAYTLADLQKFSTRFKGRPVTIYVLGDRKRLDLAALGKIAPVQEVNLDSLFPY